MLYGFFICLWTEDFHVYVTMSLPLLGADGNRVFTDFRGIGRFPIWKCEKICCVLQSRGGRIVALSMSLSLWGHGDGSYVRISVSLKL